MNKLIVPFLLLFLASCDNNLLFDENSSIDNMSWAQNDVKSFNYQVDDTLQACNFYMNIRHTEDFAFSNLYVFLKTEFPNGEAARDTMEFILQEPDGKWKGSGAGSLRDNSIMFKQNLRFPLKGMYRFSFEQAMREPQLKGISEIGLRIEKFQNP
ncbi:MAG: gliding motility lipoprotein GldH [Bacteroidetes bacterium]|nr:gliding motility lipoprotein GldH [Bacteroidota bacterium]